MASSMERCRSHRSLVDHRLKAGKISFSPKRRRARQTEDAHAAADVVRGQHRRRAAGRRAQTAETARDESLERIVSLRENDALLEDSRITGRNNKSSTRRSPTYKNSARQRPAPSGSRPTLKVIRSQDQSVDARRAPSTFEILLSKTADRLEISVTLRHSAVFAVSASDSKQLPLTNKPQQGGFPT